MKDESSSTTREKPLCVKQLSPSSSPAPSVDSISVTEEETGSEDSSSSSSGLAMSGLATSSGLAMSGLAASSGLAMSSAEGLSDDDCRDDKNEKEVVVDVAVVNVQESSVAGPALRIEEDNDEAVSSIRREPPPNEAIFDVDFELHVDEAKEEVHVLLANVDRRHGHNDSAKHDEALRDGTAQHLARCLHRLILRKCPEPPGTTESSSQNTRPPPASSSKPIPTAHGRAAHPTRRIAYRSTLEPSRAIQVTALCRALHHILTRCTETTLQEHLSTEDETLLVPSALTKNLLSSLPIVIHLLATASSDLSNSSYSLEGGHYDDDACFVRQSTSTASCLVRLSGLGSAIGIVERIVPLVHALPTSPCSGSTQLRISLLGQVLISLLGLSDQPSPLSSKQDRRRHPTPLHMPSDLRVDAATALTSLLPPSRLAIKPLNQTLPSRMQELANGSWLQEGHVSAAIIALLSTGAAVGTPETDEMSRRCMEGLLRLARWNSGALSGKLLGRRRVVTALCDHLELDAERDQAKPTLMPRCGSERHVTNCIELAKAILQNAPVSKGEATLLPLRDRSKRRHKESQSTVQESVQLLTGTIIRRLLQESLEGTKLSLMDVLVLLVEKGWLPVETPSERSKKSTPIHTSATVLNVLFLFASSASASEDFVVSAASRYLQAAKALETAPVLSAAVDLLASPFSNVREQTFQALIDLCFWKIEEAQLLVGQSSLLERLGHAIRDGCEADSAKSISISKHLVVFSRSTQLDFCGNENYVAAIVALVTTEPIKDRIVYGDAVDVLLELMSVPNQLHRFVVHDEKLLPWLVKFANRTSDEELKRRAAGIIVRYSNVLLVGFEGPSQD